MPSERIGTAHYTVSMDNAPLRQGVGRAESLVRGLGRKVGMIFGAEMARRIAVGAVRAFAAFESQMANVSTMLDDVDAHLDRLTAGAERFSIRFGKAAGDEARALYDILSASIDAADAVGVLEAANLAAVGGITEVATSTDALTTLLNSYGLSADRATWVSDVLFATVKRGKLTFDQLARGIGNVASTAAMVNIQLPELGAILATLTRNGLSSARAIVSVDAILRAFLRPTEQATKAAKALGFELNAGALASQGLLRTLESLRGARAEQIASIFTESEALRGTTILVQKLDHALDDLKSTTNAQGATQKAANKIMDTTAMKLQQLEQRTELLKRAAGADLVDIARAWGDIYSGRMPRADFSGMREVRERPAVPVPEEFQVKPVKSWDDYNETMHKVVGVMLEIEQVTKTAHHEASELARLAHTDYIVALQKQLGLLRKQANAWRDQDDARKNAARLADREADQQVKMWQAMSMRAKLFGDIERATERIVQAWQGFVVAAGFPSLQQVEDLAEAERIASEIFYDQELERLNHEADELVRQMEDRGRGPALPARVGLGYRAGGAGGEDPGLRKQIETAKSTKATAINTAALVELYKPWARYK